jgi:hypothetical protein
MKNKHIIEVKRKHFFIAIFSKKEIEIFSETDIYRVMESGLCNCKSFFIKSAMNL